MAASTPMKRRKLRGPTRFSALPSRLQVTPPWPTARIPTEIFSLIASYVPRSTIQSMRLVNKEFERKVSAYLFQVVVVPFKPEIYGVAPEPPLGGHRATEVDEPQMILLQDKGMRVFQGFGRNIRKFALSFEFDVHKLNNPPMKNAQEAITTFWGIYAWPHQRYNRYAQLEGLEQTADETKTMAKAMRYITGANELGLSIDGGLGWLSGPDVNIRVLERSVKPAVFGNSKYALEPKLPYKSQVRYMQALPSEQDQRYHELEQMCKTAGYRDEYLEEAICMMLKNEPAPPPSDEASVLKAAAAHDSQSRDRLFQETEMAMRYTTGTVTGPAASANGAQSGFGRALGPSPVTAHTTQLPVNGQPSAYDQYLVNATAMGLSTNGSYPNYNLTPYTGFPSVLAATTNAINAVGRHANHQLTDLCGFPDLFGADDDQGGAVKTMDFDSPWHATKAILEKQRQRQLRIEVKPLKPADLTVAQKEMLMEIKWAQQAFVQSYTIAVLDNTDVFSGVSTLTIARLPSCHLSMLRREDFWDSLQNLTKLSLAIIPDWRDVAKDPAGGVNEVSLEPSASVDGVFELLREHIADRKNIKSLHLEWVGGGEYAAGMFCRNCHVMPAPIVSTAIEMVDRKQAYPVLRLPHLKHFSMKNCYATPHILRKFLWSLKEDGIESITFDSVSLTANIPQGILPLPLQNLNMAQAQAPPAAFGQIQAGATQGNAVNLAIPPFAAQNTLLAVHDPNALPDWLQPARPDSWASIIDVLTPRQTIAQCRYARGFGYQPESSPPTSINKLDFTSCGYVRIPLEFNQLVLISPTPTLMQDDSIGKRKSDIEAQMVKPTDSLLGLIVNYIRPREVNALQNIFALTVGWATSGNDREKLRADCELDGFPDAGRGRFDGIIITADLAR